MALVEHVDAPACPQDTGPLPGPYRGGLPASERGEPQARGLEALGMAGGPRKGSGYRADDDPRPDLRRLAAELDGLLRTVGDVRASRLRQLADARSARRGPAAPEAPGSDRPGPARPDP